MEIFERYLRDIWEKSEKVHLSTTAVPCLLLICDIFWMSTLNVKTCNRGFGLQGATTLKPPSTFCGSTEKLNPRENQLYLKALN